MAVFSSSAVLEGVDFESELRLRGLDSRVSAGIALLLASGDAAGTALDVDLLAFLGIVVLVLLLPILLLLVVPLRDDVLLDDLVLMLLLLSSLSVIISFLFKLVLLGFDLFVTLLPGDLSSELSDEYSSFFLFPLSLGCSGSSAVRSDSRV